jgi:hypothetical protein
MICFSVRRCLRDRAAAGLSSAKNLERVVVDVAAGAPLSVGTRYGFRAHIASDTVSGDAQAPGNFSQWNLVAHVPASNTPISQVTRRIVTYTKPRFVRKLCGKVDQFSLQITVSMPPIAQAACPACVWPIFATLRPITRS